MALWLKKTYETLCDRLQMIALRGWSAKKTTFINYKSNSSLIPLERRLEADSFWFLRQRRRERWTIPVVDHRPSSTGLQAPELNRGPTTAALTVHFLNPFPEFSRRPTTCSDEVITEDSFSPSKISPGLRRSILLLYPGTSKTCLHQMALSAWKANAQQSISNSAIQSSVKGRRKREQRMKAHKKRRNSCKRLLRKPPSLSVLRVKLLFSFSLIFSGAFRVTVCES